ncbi:diaminopimelate decarboxylase [Enterovibrio norvegicus]|uniref:Diaminopimelate decarboxylase n=1 Tax=Enterovibrio norvegicus TaxID=188144 RepID=A0A2N7L8N1_9GAMM|nr:diaminopimelate decarboxylase [Enterovibrio norvegicus]PMN90669.1 diaminopimelate decarboxylase [Enterovibrio norvegicus]
MNYFNYVKGELFAEQVSVTELAERFGTPLFIYSHATLERHYKAFDEAFGEYPHRICYSVKANSNIALLQTLKRLGSGFDIVSIGEFERVIKAGGSPKDIIFSGLGKTTDELTQALEANISCFNLESENELYRLKSIADKLGKTATISLRINPDVDPKTHKHITTGKKGNKFGIDIDTAKRLYIAAKDMDNIDIAGVDYHIGSQICKLEPLTQAIDAAVNLILELRDLGINIRHLDVGGGLGIQYKDETPPHPAEYVNAIVERVKSHDIDLVLEPGRAIIGNAGLLVSKVEYLKRGESKNFAVIDAGMNDYIRPCLYEAWTDIDAVDSRIEADDFVCDVVGPICESSDIFAKDRAIKVAEGSYVALRSVGAYGFSMSSNYNTRPRPPEVLVNGDKVSLIRRRETYQDLLGPEYLLDEA